MKGCSTNHQGRDADHWPTEDPGVRHVVMGLLDGVASMCLGPQWRLGPHERDMARRLFGFGYILDMLSHLLARIDQLSYYTLFHWT